MNRRYLTPAIIAGAVMLSLSQSVPADESYPGAWNPITPITSLEQAQAIADFGVSYFPEYASMHENSFTGTASAIAMEVTAALNAEPASLPKETGSSSRFARNDAEQERRKEQDKRRIAKSLADALKRAQSYQYQLDLTVSCQHSGNYTITNVSRQDNDDSRSIDLLVNYVNCIDQYYAESYSIERNGPVKVRIVPLANGKIATRRVAFGNNTDSASYTVSYTHVATQKLVSRWSANYSVTGNFMPTQFSDLGFALGNFAYVIDGKIHEWYIVVATDNQEHEVDFDLAANSVAILKTNRNTTGADGILGTEDDLYRTETNYQNGGMKLSLVGFPGDTQPVRLAYTFNDIKYLDKTNVSTGNRSLSAAGRLTYAFPYFANPICTNGTYEFATPNTLQYDNNFSSRFPVTGSQIVNSSAQIQYDQDSNSDIIMTVLLGGQSGTYNLSQTGIQMCFN